LSSASCFVNPANSLSGPAKAAIKSGTGQIHCSM
jgi:hypothetical protein